MRLVTPHGAVRKRRVIVFAPHEVNVEAENIAIVMGGFFNVTHRQHGLRRTQHWLCNGDYSVSHLSHGILLLTSIPSHEIRWPKMIT
jgi:hypothetical protein